MSCIAGSSVSCPAPYSSPPGGLSSVPQWLQRGIMRNGGSGCASFMENIRENWLRSCHCEFPDLSLQIPPPSLLPSGYPPLCPHSRIIMLPRGLTQGTVGAPYHFCQPCPPTRMCWSHTQRHDPISFTIFTTLSPPAPQEREAPKLMLQGASASHQHSQQCGSR